MAKAQLLKSFFERNAKEVARDLLGQVLVHRLKTGEILKALITETEAYVGAHDQACHAFRGRTARTEVLFGEAGIAYVYLCYGIHELFNVVCSDKGDAQAVLVRGGYFISARRDLKEPLKGPGVFAREMKITRALHGKSVCQRALHFERRKSSFRIHSSPRIGVDYAGAWAQRRLRFFIYP